MKLEHFFFGLFALLWAATGMLAMHYRGELMYERRLGELSRQAPAIPQVAPAAQATPPATAVPAPDPAAAARLALQQQLEQAENEKNLLSTQVQKLQANQEPSPAETTATPSTVETPAAPEASALTDMQRKIKEAPAIATIQRYLPDQGFAVLDAGTARGLKSGQMYAVRRGHFIVAKQIEIGETVEENEAIAGVNASSLPTGETLKPGDEVIKWE
jgi:hypothetical protein